MAYQKFRDRQKSPTKRFLLILRLVMLPVYLFLGLTVIFWKDFPWFQNVNIAWKISFGILLISYSIFRLIIQIKSQHDD